jgi:hypothetical protein
MVRAFRLKQALIDFLGTSLYNTEGPLKTVVMYRQEIWSINQKDVKFAGEKYFRKVYGQVTRYRVSRIRADNELNELYCHV